MFSDAVILYLMDVSQRYSKILVRVPGGSLGPKLVRQQRIKTETVKEPIQRTVQSFPL